MNSRDWEKQREHYYSSVTSHVKLDYFICFVHDDTTESKANSTNTYAKQRPVSDEKN